MARRKLVSRKSLKPRYFLATQRLRKIASVSGIALGVYLYVVILGVFGIKGGEPLGSIIVVMVVSVSLITIMVLSLYISFKITAWLFSIYFLYTGEFNKSEAISFAHESEYPEHWVKEKNRHHREVKAR